MLLKLVDDIDTKGSISFELTLFTATPAGKFAGCPRKPARIFRVLVAKEIAPQFTVNRRVMASDYLCNLRQRNLAFQKLHDLTALRHVDVTIMMSHCNISRLKRRLIWLIIRTSN
ncbi:hypothetical protein AEYBE204_19540 [Asticcacaulis sp. YBE204]|nr:hypothetical protein AEYBE204_19540 [Asticcacaulis sp. YBE204]